MAKTVDDLDYSVFEDDDPQEDVNPNPDDLGPSGQPEEPPTNNDDGDGSEEDDDALTAYLRSKGIDANSIKMENEEGEEEEVRFSDLSREEQLQILNYNPAQNDEKPALEDDEAQLLGILRQNNMSVQDYLNAYKRHVIEQYEAETKANETPSYSIDQYTDEELFIADLKDKVPDLTEEDALKALEVENQNPELFKKKIAGLRAEYQAREKALLEQQEQEAQQAQAQQAAQFENVIVNTIQKNNSIDLGDMSLELSEDDMNEIASFILDSDAAGVRHIAKALNDPRMLVEMAWWALKGHDALNQVTQYYKKQISEARKSARTSAQSGSKPRTVVTRQKQNESNDPNQRLDALYKNLI